MKLGIIGVTPLAEMVLENMPQGKHAVYFFDDDPEKLKKYFFGHQVIGKTSFVTEAFKKNKIDSVAVCLGYLHFKKKNEMVQKFLKTKISNPKFINYSAIIAPRAKILPGVIIGKGVIVGSGTEVNPGTAIWSGAVVEHDSVIGNCSYIGPNATISGFVEVGACTLIGSGAVVLPRIKIGKFCVVGAGAVVTKNVPDYYRIAGVPARKIS